MTSGTFWDYVLLATAIPALRRVEGCRIRFRFKAQQQ